MEQSCETCRHWDGFHEDYKPGEKVWGNCLKGMSSFGKPEHEDTTAYAESGELVDFLRSRQDHYCSMWTDREGTR